MRVHLKQQLVQETEALAPGLRVAQQLQQEQVWEEAVPYRVWQAWRTAEAVQAGQAQGRAPEPLRLLRAPLQAPQRRLPQAATH